MAVSPEPRKERGRSMIDDGWYERVDKLWLDVALLEEIGPSRFGLSDLLMNWIYSDLRKITVAGAPEDAGSYCDMAGRAMIPPEHTFPA